MLSLVKVCLSLQPFLVLWPSSSNEKHLDFYSLHDLWILTCQPGTKCKIIFVECVLWPLPVVAAVLFIPGWVKSYPLFLAKGTVLCCVIEENTQPCSPNWGSDPLPLTEHHISFCSFQDMWSPIFHTGMKYRFVKGKRTMKFKKISHVRNCICPDHGKAINPVKYEQ